MPKKIVIAFVPVLHDGYRKFFVKNKNAKALFIFSEKIIRKDFPHLLKEIRALKPSLMVKLIKSLGIFKSVELLSMAAIKKIQKNTTEIICPDEDVSRALVEKYFSDKKSQFDKIFLRWDKHKSMEEKPVGMDQIISKKIFDQEIIGALRKEAEKSSDWWRRVASAIVKDGQIIFMNYNRHQPSEHTAYVEGDPRNNFHQGVGIEFSHSFHSEAALIAEAARNGVSLEGASIYTLVFPCPPCAKLIAHSGIKKLYYAGGYSLLNQERILKSKGVEIIYVKY